MEASQKSVVANPRACVTHYFLALGYEGSGRPAQAIPEYQQAVELSQGDSDTTARMRDSEDCLAASKERGKESVYATKGDESGISVGRVK
jgi:hypothetical protein